MSFHNDSDEQFGYVCRSRVYCSECKQWVSAENLDVLNVEEDIQGRDVVTFECSQCGTEQKSLIVG